MQRSTLNRSGLAVMAGVMALGVGAAQAQPYGYNGFGGGAYSYDPCKRDKTSRGTVGALIGGAIGAVIGSNAAAGGVRTEGSLLGGAVGAGIGAAVGNSSAACQPGQYTAPPPAPAALPPAPPPGPPSVSYYDRAPAYERDLRPRARYGYYDDAYAYGRRGETYRLAEGRDVGPDGCTLAESPVFLPDGRTQTRFVRVCRDASGRYGVVD